MKKQEAMKVLEKLNDNFEVDLKIYPVCCRFPMEPVYNAEGKVIMHFCRKCKKFIESQNY